MIAAKEAGKHMFADAHPFPYCILKSVLGGKLKKQLDPSIWTEEEVAVAGAYWSLMLQRHGQVETVFMNTLKFFCYALHNMHGPDRMGNPEIQFPVAFCFGDRDFFGTEGADSIVRKNVHFSSGRSQLFKLENSGHNLMGDQPEKLVEYMVGFFEGTITGHFDLKPKA